MSSPDDAGPEAPLREVERLQHEARGATGLLVLEWSAAAGPDGLRVAYAVRSAGGGGVYLLDRVVVLAPRDGFAEEPAAAVALPSPDAPGTLRLLRGYVPARRSLPAVELVPGARLLAPGATLEGTIVVPLPAREWHPADGPHPLPAPPSALELRLGVLPLFCALADLALADGSRIPVPRHADAHLYQQWLAAPPQPMPAAAP
ncbi:MAG: hypothetical protein JWM27_3280 [Gemmatimonadetes bacterium]|nr:hypothetical protein [Gemmatimonadota bacterium]